jgi:crossover junction endodeoxyribonuclease RuvC
MRLLGVDPGSIACGWGVIDASSGSLEFIAAATIRAPQIEPAPARLLRIYRGLSSVIREYCPAVLSLERHFVARNIQSAFRIGEARAMAMLAAQENSIPIVEYPPNQVKLAVAGHGHAGKDAVMAMVRRTLNIGSDVALAADASDALALAICHAMRGRGARLTSGIERNRPPATRSRL